MPTNNYLAEETPQTTQTRSPVPIVITGTMPRDEETLRLAKYLNSESAAGNIEVFYFADADLSDPILTSISKSDTRLVNPLRIPEDLDVTGSVEVKDAKDETGYYANVAQMLRDQGREAICLAYPVLTSNAVVPVTVQLLGNSDDHEYYNFNRGRNVTFNVSLFGQVALLNAEQALELVGPANISRMHLLSGPVYSAPEVDHALTDEDMVRVFTSGFNKEIGAKYRAKLLNHLIERGSKKFQATTDFAPIDRAGIKYTLQANARKLTDEAIDTISASIVADPAIEIARETADSILTAAQLSADELAEKAKTVAQALIDEAQAESSTILARASQDADELVDGAIEAAALIPELPQMLAGPIATILGDRKSKEQQMAEEKIARSRDKQLAVKNRLDDIVKSFDILQETRITSWGHGWQTEAYKKDKRRAMEAMSKAKSSDGSLIQRFSEIETMIDAANLGQGAMTIEDATLGIGLTAFVREVPKLDAYQKLLLWTDTYDREQISLESWDIDQVQMDRAFFNSLLSHCATSGFSENDRMFLETCDHTLGGEISQSLRRSLDGRLMDRSFDEISAGDPFAKAMDTAGLLDEVEAVSREQSVISNGGHISGSLRSTLEEVNRAAALNPTASLNPATTANIPTTTAPSMEPIAAAMRSDGTVVQFPGR